jgi:hypothetical protein
MRNKGFFYAYSLSSGVRKKIEQFIVGLAIGSFLLHLLVIFLVDFDILPLNESSDLLKNPIAAIYTPFSFILIYEVYLLVYYLPKSITIYIGKQYEIITLILIRRVFKDLSQIELTSDWFSVQNDLQLTYDLVATLLLFFLLLLFYRLNERKDLQQQKIADSEQSPELRRYIRMKNIVAVALVPVFVLLGLYSFGRWVYENFVSINQMVYHIKDVNNVFFDEFFTILILTDVLLLLISFLHIDKFNKIIRDSGFIISTILIKLSFGVEGLLNTILIVAAVLFGVIILAIHNAFEKVKLPSGE